MLLCGDWIVPISSPPLPDGGVLVAGGVIADVGAAEELKRRHPGEEVRAFPGCALLPGLVNAHTHLEYSAFCGFAPACGFGEWMLRLLMARRKLDPEDYAASALWGAHECVRSGVTTIADTTYAGLIVAGAARAAGLRARVYLEVFGLDDSELPTAMRRLEDGLDKLGGEGVGGGAGEHAGGAAPAAALVEAGISPHAPYTVSARLYRETARLARRRGLRLATHLAESQSEVELLLHGSGAIALAYKAANLWGGQRWRPPGESPVKYVAGTGALGPNTLVVHAVQIDDADIAALAASGAAVAHCPRSNLRLECGIAPVAELAAAGVTVGLGTDGLCSNEDLDMFAEMRAALAVSRERALRGARAAAGAALGCAPGAPPATGLTKAPLTPTVVLRMATLDGARALGWDRLIGSLEVGKRADVIAVRLPEAPEPSGLGADPVAALVGAATADDVALTMVDGAILSEGDLIPEAVARAVATVRAKLGLGAR